MATKRKQHAHKKEAKWKHNGNTTGNMMETKANTNDMEAEQNQNARKREATWKQNGSRMEIKMEATWKQTRNIMETKPKLKQTGSKSEG